MSIKTLLHLNYLNRVFILVNQENYDDYSLHAKVGNRVERKVFKDVEGNAKERLAAYLITMQRYYVFLERKETGKSEEEVQWDESFLQLAQFIDHLIPGYSFRLLYLERETIQKEENKWISTYSAYVVNYNRLKEKKPVFRLLHANNKQKVEWIETEEYLNTHYLNFQSEFNQIKEDELLTYQYETNPNKPDLFEGFGDLLD